MNCFYCFIFVVGGGWGGVTFSINKLDFLPFKLELHISIFLQRNKQNSLVTTTHVYETNTFMHIQPLICSKMYARAKCLSKLFDQVIINQSWVLAEP